MVQIRTALRRTVRRALRYVLSWAGHDRRERVLAESTYQEFWAQSQQALALRPVGQPEGVPVWNALHAMRPDIAYRTLDIDPRIPGTKLEPFYERVKALWDQAVVGDKDPLSRRDSSDSPQPPA